MANYASSIRRIRKSRKANQRNRAYRSMMRTAIKSVLSETDKNIALSKYAKTVSLLDKLASKKVIHKNKAANQKSRLALYINKL